MLPDLLAIRPHPPYWRARPLGIALTRVARLAQHDELVRVDGRGLACPGQSGTATDGSRLSCDHVPPRRGMVHVRTPARDGRPADVRPAVCAHRVRSDDRGAELAPCRRRRQRLLEERVVGALARGTAATAAARHVDDATAIKARRLHGITQTPRSVTVGRVLPPCRRRNLPRHDSLHHTRGPAPRPGSGSVTPQPRHCPRDARRRRRHSSAARPMFVSRPCAR